MIGSNGQLLTIQKILKDELPGGLWPVMLTPFTDDNSIDYTGLDSLTDFYVSTGANGLFANCYSSEMNFLSQEERVQLTKAVVDISAGRVPMISTGTFYTTTDENIDFIK